SRLVYEDGVPAARTGSRNSCGGSGSVLKGGAGILPAHAPLRGSREPDSPPHAAELSPAKLRRTLVSSLNSHPRAGPDDDRRTRRNDGHRLTLDPFGAARGI